MLILRVRVWLCLVGGLVLVRALLGLLSGSVGLIGVGLVVFGWVRVVLLAYRRFGVVQCGRVGGGFGGVLPYRVLFYSP